MPNLIHFPAIAWIPFIFGTQEQVYRLPPNAGVRQAMMSSITLLWLGRIRAPYFPRYSSVSAERFHHLPDEIRQSFHFRPDSAWPSLVQTPVFGWWVDDLGLGLYQSDIDD